MENLKGLTKRQQHQKYFETYLKHKKLELNLAKSADGKYLDESVESRFIDFFNGFVAGITFAAFKQGFEKGLRGERLSPSGVVMPAEGDNLYVGIQDSQSKPLLSLSGALILDSDSQIPFQQTLISALDDGLFTDAQIAKAKELYFQDLPLVNIFEILPTEDSLTYILTSKVLNVELICKLICAKTRNNNILESFAEVIKIMAEYKNG